MVADLFPAAERTTLTDTSPCARLSLERRAGEPFAYLTTTGRHTGAPHRIEIWFAVEDGRVYLLSSGHDRSDWVWNLQVDPSVTIELGTEAFAGIARVIAAGTSEDRRARELLVQNYRKGNDLDEWGRTSLRLTQRGVVAIPKSVHIERMAENFNIFDVQLSSEEMPEIATLDTGASSFFDQRDPAVVKQLSTLPRNTE